jgi:hypothetical protein
MGPYQLNIRLVMSTVSNTKSASQKVIVAFFKRRKPGSVFTRTHMFDQIDTMTGGEQTSETVMRNLRKLRERGVLDYSCVDQNNGKYKVISVPS